MDADRWSRIEQLYHQAAGLASHDRAAFLARECESDPILLQEIESLLAEDVSSAPFLDEPALAVAARLVADEVPVLTDRMFGPYRIEGLLGAGGMGDVYRARDTVLGRDVAIKILPEAFNDDPDRLARFEKEAQFLASLSHPNIAAIYGVHESGGLRGLVLELVDGETLAERIERGPIPLHDAARIARQIGDGLDAAHQRGIVHRDLKPSNIKVARDGTTKILDFGLAKSAAVGSLAADRDPSSIAGESDGGAFGTPSYMSPEQARGDFVDKRTDIWAFGCVCFEMLTGHPAFRRETADGDRQGPVEPPWRLMPPEVPAAVTSLLKRCLDADSQRRRRDVGDVLVDLDDALRPASAPAQAPRRFGWLAVAGGLVLLFALAATLWRSGQLPIGPTGASHAVLSMLLPPGMDFPEQDSQMAVSPDGTMIAYVAAAGGEAPRLLLRRLNTASTQVLGDALAVRDPFFSPDSRELGFFAGDTLRTMSIADGRSRVICQAPGGESASWGNGFIVFGETGDLPKAGIRRVAEDGGPVETISSPNRDLGETRHLSPQMLPDGRTVMYTVNSAYADGGATYRIVVQPPGGPARVLIDDARAGRYVGDSVLLYQRERSLFATTLDLQSLTPPGPGVMLFNDLSPSGRPRWSTGGAVLVYRPRDENRRFVWVGRDGAEVSLPSPLKRFAAPSLSPAGDRIAVEAEEDGRFDIWMLDIERQTPTKVTTDGASRYPMWTPDGAHVGVVQRRDYSLYWIARDGTGRRELVGGPNQKWIGSWTPDLRTLIYMEQAPDTHSDLWAIDLQTKARPRLLVRSLAREYGGRLSPDGRWLAYFSDETGRSELYLTAFAPGAPRHRIPTGDGRARPREAVWAKTGDELFFRQGAQMLSIRVPSGAMPSESRPTVLFEGDYFATGGPGIVNYDVSPDGRRFLMLKPVENRPAHLNVVQGLDRLTRERLHPEAR